MTSGKLLPLLTLSLLTLISRQVQSRTLEELESALARVPPVSTSFVEYRFSHVLKRATQTRGKFEYRADGVMARTVESPYQEHTEVSGGEVRVQRAERPMQKFSLQRAPQLRVLLDSFRALLDGHLTPLSQDFEVTLTEESPHWRITLKPRDERLGKYLANIQVYGSADRPNCLEAIEPDGDATVTLFDRADAPAPVHLERAALEQQCRVGTHSSPRTP
jgi:hypothetical protein